MTVPSAIAGRYAATILKVTPSGQNTIDFLAQGGTMSVTIGANGTTTGVLTAPSSLAGTNAPFSESMVGTAVQTGSTVKFQQSADTFVRDLVWTVNGSALEVKDQTVGSAVFTATLSRQ